MAVAGAAAAGLVAVLALSACIPPAGGGAATPGEAPVVLPQSSPGPREDVPSALDNMRNPAFPPPLIDPDKIESGGPPPDGIPAIDQPTFLRADAVDWLADTEAVLVLTVSGETRAYPVQVMVWHEIVNDTVGAVPVAVTYCPLCNSGVAFDRRAAGRLLSFGTSGRLYADNLVMYDRQTQSLWPQLTFTASVGVLTGTRLTPHVLQTVAWREFRVAYPQAWVLSRETGHPRAYGRNPYVGYDDPDGGLLVPIPGLDQRERLKERVIGIGEGAAAVAVLRSSVAAAGVLEVTVDGRVLVVWHRPGQASALDGRTVGGGRDIGTVGVFDPVLDGRRLRFALVGDGFRDEQTSSSWDVLGRAVGGPLTGRALTPVTHLDTFWFAWVAFQPQTTIIR
ncbi:MAG: DUF3179 domain-containing protein [Sporichthyaceae bacterium]|nr:DUF3179 domain-containing protein [Sporichthyaceae bacterium]